MVEKGIVQVLDSGDLPRDVKQAGRDEGDSIKLGHVAGNNTQVGRVSVGERESVGGGSHCGVGDVIDIGRGGGGDLAVLHPYPLHRDYVCNCVLVPTGVALSGALTPQGQMAQKLLTSP